MILAIDLGGTSSKCAFVDNQGNIIMEFIIATTKNDILLNIKQNVDNILQDKTFSWNQITNIGIAVPGFYDMTSGIVRLAGNLNFYDYPFLKMAKSIFKKPIIVINDANATAYGQYSLQTNNNQNLIVYTLGTGIGGGIILNGQLITGYNGYAGEFGHGGNFQNQFPCTCGLNHCVEAISSATGFNKIIKQYVKSNSTSHLAQLNNSNHISTVELKQLLNNKTNSSEFHEVASIINHGLGALTDHMSTMIYALNPQTIMLAGGLTLLGPEFLKLLKAQLFTKISAKLYGDTEIIFAQNQERAGLIGIICYTMQTINKGG